MLQGTLAVVEACLLVGLSYALSFELVGLARIQTLPSYRISMSCLLVPVHACCSPSSEVLLYGS